MAKVVKYDVTNVEATGGGSEQPKPGVYPAKIAICRQRETKADGSPANDIEVAFNLGGDYAFVFTYIGLSDASDWKLKEFVDALGLKGKGQFDPDKLIGKMIRVKINPDSYDGEYRGRAGRLMKAQKGDKLAEASEGVDDEDADADGDVDEDTAAEAKADVDSTGDHEFTATREDPEDDEVGSYDDWADEDLAAEVEDRGLTVPGGRGSKRTKHIAALRADDTSSMDDDEETEPEAEEEGEAEDDYDTWSVDELIAEGTERELALPRKPRGSGAEERYKEALVKLLRKDDGANPF